MQPLPVTARIRAAKDKPPVRGLVWRIQCDKDLTVTMVVVDRYILLLSDEGTGTPWRMGTYSSGDEVSRKAVEMTGSYERLRHGKVNQYAEAIIAPPDVELSLEQQKVHPLVEAAIESALSPTTSAA